MPTHRADSRASIETIWSMEGDSLRRAGFEEPKFATDVVREETDDAKRRLQDSQSPPVYGSRVVDANGNSLAGKPIEPEVWHAG